MELGGFVAVASAVMMQLSVVFFIYFTVRFRKIEQVGNETLKRTVAIDHAVNGKDPRDATISEDVMAIRSKQERDQPTTKDISDEALLPLVRSLKEELTELRSRIDKKI